jgi:hypothetical protein
LLPTLPTAMFALWVATRMREAKICDLQNADNNAEAIARSAYKIADAMLRVREEKQETQEPAIPPGTLVETGSEE